MKESLSKARPCKLRVGDKFGKFIIIATVKYPDEQRRFVCRCECGNEVEKSYGDVKRGGVCRSCADKAKVLPNFLMIKKIKFNEYRQNASHTERIFELTFEQFITLIERNCSYCNASPDQYHTANRAKMYNPKGYRYNGIDRVDSTKGYTQENTVTCCKLCNGLKSNLLTSVFLNQIERIYQHQQKLLRNSSAGLEHLAHT